MIVVQDHCVLLSTLSFRHMKTVIITLLLFVCIINADPLAEAKKYKPIDYKRNMLNPPNGPLGFIKTPGGNVSYMNSTTNPVLEGKGVGLSLSILQPCGIILPHLHPRASKIMYSIDGENIMIGFIQENGAPTVFNTLRKGEAAFVPQGAIMFFQNLGCKPVTQIFGYNHEDPGLLTLGIQMFKMPDEVLQTGFGLNQNQVENLRELIPDYPLDVNSKCRQRCGLSP